MNQSRKDKIKKYQDKDERLREEYDKYSSNLPFWYLDALFSGATEKSSYRKESIDTLNLKTDSQVLDIACGMGANFFLLENILNDTGKIVGLDLSDKLLNWAAGKILKHNWKNVELVQKSITEYAPGVQYNAIMCSFAMEIIPDFETTVDKIYELLKPKGRFSMIGMKLSSKYPLKILNPLFQTLYSQYDIDFNRDFISLFKSHSMNVEYYRECHFGYEYILTVSK